MIAAVRSVMVPVVVRSESEDDVYYSQDNEYKIIQVALSELGIPSMNVLLLSLEDRGGVSDSLCKKVMA